MARTVGKLIEQFTIDTEVGKHIVPLRLNTKTGRFSAHLDDDRTFEADNLRDLKDTVRRIICADVGALAKLAPAIEYRLVLDNRMSFYVGYINENREHPIVGLEFRVIMLTGVVEGPDGDQYRLHHDRLDVTAEGEVKVHGDPPLKQYRPPLESRVLPFTPERYQALRAVQQAILAARRRLVEVLLDGDAEAVQARLDALGGTPLLTAGEE